MTSRPVLLFERIYDTAKDFDEAVKYITRTKLLTAASRNVPQATAHLGYTLREFTEDRNIVLYVDDSFDMARPVRKAIEDLGLEGTSEPLPTPEQEHVYYLGCLSEELYLHMSFARMRLLYSVKEMYRYRETDNMFVPAQYLKHNLIIHTSLNEIKFTHYETNWARTPFGELNAAIRNFTASKAYIEEHGVGKYLVNSDSRVSYLNPRKIMV